MGTRNCTPSITAVLTSIKISERHYTCEMNSTVIRDTKCAELIEVPVYYL